MESGSLEGSSPASITTPINPLPPVPRMIPDSSRGNSGTSVSVQIQTGQKVGTELVFEISISCKNDSQVVF